MRNRYVASDGLNDLGNHPVDRKRRVEFGVEVLAEGGSVAEFKLVRVLPKSVR
jgi:hypothetical protein